MPVTRKQKDASSRPESRPSVRDSTEETSGSEGVTSASASASSGTTAATSDTNTSSGTTATQDTTVTENTVATATTTTAESEKRDAAQKETTKKIPEDVPVKEVRDLDATLKPTGVSRRAKSTSSSARRRELEAREELARLELKQARAAANLARVRLELAQCDEEDSVDGDQEDRTAQVQNWIESSVLGEANKEQPELRGQLPSEPQKVKPEENSSTK